MINCRAGVHTLHYGWRSVIVRIVQYKYISKYVYFKLQSVNSNENGKKWRFRLRYIPLPILCIVPGSLINYERRNSMRHSQSPSIGALWVCFSNLLRTNTPPMRISGIFHLVGIDKFAITESFAQKDGLYPVSGMDINLAYVPSNISSLYSIRL